MATRSTFDSAQLARMTLGEMDSWYRQGVVSQDQYEAYRWVWATASHDGYANSIGWTSGEYSDAVHVIASELRTELGLS